MIFSDNKAPKLLDMVISGSRRGPEVGVVKASARIVTMPANKVGRTKGACATGLQSITAGISPRCEVRLTRLRAR
jgi:hypothetical protein